MSKKEEQRKQLTTQRVVLEVFLNREQDYTFRVINSGAPSATATHILLDCYDTKGALLHSAEIPNDYGYGFLTYNETINTKDHTLRSQTHIREDIINRYNLQVGQRIPATLTIEEDGTHRYKLVIPEQ